MFKAINLFFFAAVTFQSCTHAPDGGTGLTHANSKAVKLMYEDGRYSLVKGGKRVFVKGALGHSHLNYLKEIGGNTINVYHDRLSRKIFHDADSLGLNVAVTLNLGRPYQGANYDDTVFVNAQRHMVDSIVTLYKDEPALLFWIIGNEMHLEMDWSGNVWEEVNTISTRIHRLDPDHLTTTNIAAFDRKQLFQVKYFCTDIDFLSFNAHHRNYLLQRELRNILWGWNGAYLITEWTGPVYWHEMSKTTWGAPLEPSSTAKTEMFAHNYHIAIERDSTYCLGGFVFYWGEKQERTHTMFSLILDEYYKTQPLEVLEYFWQGKGLKNYSPRITSFGITGQDGQDAIQLHNNSSYNLSLQVNDPESDSLWMKIEIYREGKYDNIFGGDFEQKPEKISWQVYPDVADKISITTPREEGPYRVFVYIYDKEYVATANLPFYVLPF